MTNPGNFFKKEPTGFFSEKQTPQTTIHRPPQTKNIHQAMEIIHQAMEIIHQAMEIIHQATKPWKSYKFW